MNEFRNPYFNLNDNLEICIGAVNFRDEVILNLREQIKNLRESLSNYEETEVIEANQYKHIIKSWLDYTT